MTLDLHFRDRAMGVTSAFAGPLRIATVLATGLSAPVAAQEAPVTPIPVATIGCQFCEGPEQFGVVTALALGGERLVVGDRDAPHLRIFSLDGRFRAAIAPEGEGPGEMVHPLAVGSAASGISAIDMRMQRILLLTPEGGERSRRPAGSFPLAATFAPESERLAISVANFRERTAGLVRWEPSADRLETVMESVEEIVLSTPDQPPLYFSVALAPSGAVVIGEGLDLYRIQVFSADGVRERELIREIARTPKTDEEIQAERESRAAAMARMAEGEGGTASAVEIDPLRRHFSLDALRFDRAGRLWVRTDRAREGTVFDVFDPTLEYLGEVRIPDRGTAYALGEGHLAFGALDEFDLGTVKLYRLDWH